MNIQKVITSFYVILALPLIVLAVLCLWPPALVWYIGERFVEDKVLVFITGASLEITYLLLITHYVSFI